MRVTPLVRTKVEDDIVTIGIMSGTSLDGADAVAVRFRSDATGTDRMTTLGRAGVPMPPELHDALLSLALGNAPDEIERMGDAAVSLAKLYAEAVERLLKSCGLLPEDIAAIGAHGQTIRHRPERGFTLQLNHPALLAELTGISVVADFRSRDVAAGGEGAPLVPAFHTQVFPHESAAAVLNIGGIANVTILPAAADLAQGRAVVSGFDTGPGNMLLDAFMASRFGLPCDRNGELTRRGRVLEPLLKHCLEDPYFALNPPKSTGRERFSFAWLSAKLAPFANAAPEDVAATLTMLTARSAAEALARTAPETERFIVCGGGARNPELMRMLDAELRRRTAVRIFSDSSRYGLNPMDVEGAAFAWLAKAFLAGEPGNLPAVTRARGLRLLGAWYPAG